MRKAELLLCVGVLALASACGGGGAAADGGLVDTMSPTDTTSPTDTPWPDLPSVDVGGADAGAGTSLLAEAIATCTWATGCLNPEDSFGGGAPNTGVSSCLASFFAQRMRPSTTGQTKPWGVYRACRAASNDCAGFRACMLAQGAMCGAAFEWQTGIPCADGRWTCGAACSPSCTPGAAACSADSGRLEQCVDMRLRSVACADGDPGGACVMTPAGARCFAGRVGACPGASAARCQGDVLTLCDRGVEVTLDCAAAGQTCSNTMGCVDGVACRFDVGDTCTGNTLRVCLSGNFRDIDCVAQGGTCGTLRSGRPGCVFPEGAALDAGAPADAGGPVDAGADAGPPDVAGACNDLPVPATVNEMMQAGSIPAPTGGAIVPGHYALSAWWVYAPDRVLPQPHITAVRFSSDGTFVSYDGGMRFAGTWATTGAQLDLNITCPVTVTARLGYTAAATTVTLFDTAGGARDQRVYTRVP